MLLGCYQRQFNEVTNFRVKKTRICSLKSQKQLRDKTADHTVMYVYVTKKKKKRLASCLGCIGTYVFSCTDILRGFTCRVS